MKYVFGLVQMSVKALYHLVLAIDIGGQILTDSDLYDGKIVVEEVSIRQPQIQHSLSIHCKRCATKKHRHNITSERCLVVEKIYLEKYVETLEDNLGCEPTANS